MNILIKFGPYGEMLTVAPEHTVALLALVPHLRRVTANGYDASRTYDVDTMPPEVSFEDSTKLAPVSPREAALKDALEKKESQWLGAFTERDAQKKRADELQREVDRLRAGIPSVADDERAP